MQILLDKFSFLIDGSFNFLQDNPFAIFCAFLMIGGILVDIVYSFIWR